MDMLQTLTVDLDSQVAAMKYAYRLLVDRLASKLLATPPNPQCDTEVP